MNLLYAPCMDHSSLSRLGQSECPAEGSTLECLKTGAHQALWDDSGHQMAGRTGWGHLEEGLLWKPAPGQSQAEPVKLPGAHPAPGEEFLQCG